MRGLWVKGVAAAALMGVSLLGASASAQTATRNEGADAADSAATRARIAPGDTISGSLTPGGDKDWYRATLEAGTYRVSLTGAGEGDAALGDPLVRVVNSAGGEVARDDDGGEGLNSYLEFDAPTRGTYFIEARGFGDDAAGRYTLHLARGDIPASAATDVALDVTGDQRDGRLSPAGDKDWYSIDLTAGQTVRLALNNGSANGVGDPLMVIYDAQGKELARDDDGGGELNSYLEFSAPAAGRYFVEARGFSDDATGTYSLQLTPGEIGATTETAETLGSSPTPRTSQISPAGDVDWFAFDVVEGRPYRIFLDPADGDGALPDPKLTLYDGDGHQVAEDDDGGKGVSARIGFTPTTSGTYYAAASSYDPAGTGRYTLHISDYEVPGSSGTDEMLEAASDSRASRIDMPGDKDWYGAEFSEGATYRIEVAGAPGAAGLTRATVSIMTDEGISVATSQGSGRRAALTFHAPKDATLYVQVTGVGEGVGDYTLTTTRTDQH